MEKYKLKVGGMSCSGCEENVENAVSKVEGVLDIDADHKNNKVDITTESENIDKVEKAIYNAGYDVEN